MLAVECDWIEPEVGGPRKQRYAYSTLKWLPLYIIITTMRLKSNLAQVTIWIFSKHLLITDINNWWYKALSVT